MELRTNEIDSIASAQLLLDCKLIPSTKFLPVEMNRESERELQLGKQPNHQFTQFKQEKVHVH